MQDTQRSASAFTEGGTMTEAEARAGYDDLEPWLASQPWRLSLAGWRVVGMQGCRFDIEAVSEARLRITARPAGGNPCVWTVPYQR